MSKKNSFSLGWNWLTKGGPFFKAVDYDLGGKDVDVWFNEYRGHVNDWLKKNVAQ